MKSKLLIFLLLAVIAFSFQGCHVVRYVVWGFADYDDYEKFPSVSLEPSDQPFQFVSQTDSASSLQLPESILVNKKELPFNKALSKSDTYAFLVIRKDTVLYEYYQDPLDQQTPAPSFSVAKSFVGTLVGMAIDEGSIGSVEDTITQYLDLPKDKGFEKITIEDLLTMRSGIDFSEGYFNPFSDIGKLYYGTNLRSSLKTIKIKRPPKRGFKYHSFNTQLLGFILEKATGMSIDRYAEAKIWKPLGMEHAASWSLDSKKNQNVKAFCCLNATARDFAKLGRLYLHRGTWEGKQLLSQSWVEESKNFARGGWYVYSYHWWNGDKDEADAIMAVGVLDQYIYVNFDQDVIMVRLGNNGKVKWSNVFKEIMELNPIAGLPQAIPESSGK